MTARFNGPLTWSLVAIGATLLAVLMNVPAIARAMLMPPAKAAQNFQAAAQEIWDLYDETEATYLARFDGRSVFFEPRQERTLPTRPRPTPPPDDGPRTPPPPPPPATKPRYGGPDPRTLHDDMAIFVDGTRLRIGETNGGLKLLGVEPPWIARVEHRGWEYELSLFARSDFDDYFQRKAKPIGEANAPEKGEAVALAEDDTAPAPDSTSVRAAASEDRSDMRATAAADTTAAQIRREESAARAGRESGDSPDEDRKGRTARTADVEIPEPLTDAQMQSMTKVELRTHLGKLSRARTALSKAGDEADGELKERIDREWKMVLTRMRELK